MKTIFLIAFVLLGGATVSYGQPVKHISMDELQRVRLPEVVLESVALERNTTIVNVKGVIGGNIRFELLLPETWNGRFVMGGGGGFVGTVQNSARYSVVRGYATAGTDAGHEWPVGYMAGWAQDNLEAQLNFGYLAVHRTAEASKALIRAYYGTDATFCYFTGCSRGGGQAMMEAQRFPQDFDGIVAGAPAFDWTGIAAAGITLQRMFYPDPAHLDHPVLDLEALQKLQQAIIEQCDALDGLKDGVVQDPPSVHFDLSKVPGLTDEQRKLIQAMYAGVYQDGHLIYPGYTPGSECDPKAWVEWITGPSPSMATNHVPDLGFAFSTQIFKFLIFNNPDWNYATYNFANFASDTRLAASYLNATNTDLSAFKSRKGKLILWHGWADPALPPQATVNYYGQLLARDPDAATYCRLFMVPGCEHCGGGPGASDVDWVTIVSDWVEHTHAPDRVIASKREAGKVLETRPLYQYPGTAIYKGSGDPSRAESFVEKPRVK